MWNYLVSALQVGSTLVLYDGSPLKDPAYLWKLTDELKITVFGTSAKYLEQLAVSNAERPLLFRFIPRAVELSSLVQPGGRADICIGFS